MVSTEFSTNIATITKTARRMIGRMILRKKFMIKSNELSIEEVKRISDN
jgi:hypothetical protein